MTYIKSVLAFLNILDREGNLSITNLAVIITLTKLAIAPQASLVDTGTLLIALANYSHKRLVTRDSVKSVVVEDIITPQITELAAKVDEMQSKVSALALQSGMKINR